MRKTFTKTGREGMELLALTPEYFIQERVNFMDVLEQEHQEVLKQTNALLQRTMDMTREISRADETNARKQFEATIAALEKEASRTTHALKQRMKDDVELVEALAEGFIIDVQPEDRSQAVAVIRIVKFYRKSIKDAQKMNIKLLDATVRTIEKIVSATRPAAVKNKGRNAVLKGNPKSF